MKIDAKWDVSRLQSRFALTPKNIAFASVNAINDTAKQLQGAERANVAKNFTLRQPDFINRQVAIIKPFASVSQNRPFAVVSVGQKDRLLLSQYEAGGERKPFVGKNVAIPITGNAARTSFSARIPEALLVKNLRFRPGVSNAARARAQKIQTGSRRLNSQVRKLVLSSQAKIWEGQQNTYLVPNVGIFQRTGKGRGSSKLLYVFKSNERLPKKLGFVDLAEREGSELLQSNMDRAIAKELIRNA